MILDAATAALSEPSDPDAEAALLTPFLAAYRRRFGCAPALVRDERGPLLRFPAHEGRTCRSRP